MKKKVRCVSVAAFSSLTAPVDPGLADFEDSI